MHFQIASRVARLEICFLRTIFKIEICVCVDRAVRRVLGATKDIRMATVHAGAEDTHLAQHYGDRLCLHEV